MIVHPGQPGNGGDYQVIVNDDTIAYDNKMGSDDDGYAGNQLGGGSIKIHKAN